MSKITLIKFHNAGPLIIERKLSSIVATRPAIFVINVVRLFERTQIL